MSKQGADLIMQSNLSWTIKKLALNVRVWINEYS